MISITSPIRPAQASWERCPLNLRRNWNPVRRIGQSQSPQHPRCHCWLESNLVALPKTQQSLTESWKVSARKGRAPATPSRPVPSPAPAGITFNPVAEVVEVEKRQQRASISSQGWDIGCTNNASLCQCSLYRTSIATDVLIPYHFLCWQHQYCVSTRSTGSGSSVTSSGSSVTDNEEETTRIWPNTSMTSN